MSGQGRRVPFSHPFFDNPEEFWARRYAGMPPEYWSGGFNRPAQYDMPSRPFPPSAMQAIPSSQTSHRTTSRREWSGAAPSPLWEQHFGGDAGHSGTITSPSSFYERKPGFERQISGTSEIQTDDKNFKVSLDVQQFTPDELDVRVVDMEVLIHAKHEQRADEHGYVSREFTRRYTIPADIDPETVKSSLSEEGILSIEAPRQLAIKEPDGKKIPIQVKATSPAPAVVEAASATGEGKK